MSRGVVLAYCACALIWGTTWYAIRVCIVPATPAFAGALHFRPGVGYPTFAALALRFALAAAVLVPLAVRARPWPRGRGWLPFVIAGGLDAAGYTLVYFGEARVTGGIAAVIYGTQPLVLALLLAATRYEKITRRHVLGALVSLAGVATIFLDRLDVSARQAVGVVLVLGSVVVATTYSFIMKRAGGAVPNVIATTIFVAVTAIVLGIAAVVAGDAPPWPPPAESTLALVYLAFAGTVVAFLCFFWMLERTSLLVTSTLVFVFPLVALATDALFDRAIPLGARAYAGAAVTLAGLAVSLRRG